MSDRACVEVLPGIHSSLQAAASLDPTIPCWIEFEGRSFLHITQQNTPALGDFLRAQSHQKYFLGDYGRLRCNGKPEFDEALPQNGEEHLIIFGDSPDQLGGFTRLSVKPKDLDVRYASSIIDGSEYLRRSPHLEKMNAPGYDDYTGTGPIGCLRKIEVFTPRRGLGSCAIRYATRVLGCERIEVASTTTAVAFYVKCGFIPTGMRQDVGEADPLPVMIFKNPAIVCNEPTEFPNLALSVLDGGLLTSRQFRSSLIYSRREWTRELQLPPDSSMMEIAALIAGRISLALQEQLTQANPSTPNFIFAEAIAKASRLRGTPLIDFHDFRASKFEFFEETAREPSYWQHRVVGALRARLSGLTYDRLIIMALRNLVKDEIDHHILGREGYRRVAEIFCGGRMSKAHRLMREACEAETRDFAALGWGGCRGGGTKELGSERKRKG